MDTADFDNDSVREEYDRWLRRFGDDDPYEGEDTLGLRDVLRAHFLIVDYFLGQGSEGIGGVGGGVPFFL